MTSRVGSKLIRVLGHQRAQLFVSCQQSSRVRRCARCLPRHLSVASTRGAEQVEIAPPSASNAPRTPPHLKMNRNQEPKQLAYVPDLSLGDTMRQLNDDKKFREAVALCQTRYLSHLTHRKADDPLTYSEMQIWFQLIRSFKERPTHDPESRDIAFLRQIASSPLGSYGMESSEALAAFCDYIHRVLTYVKGCRRRLELLRLLVRLDLVPFYRYGFLAHMLSDVLYEAKKTGREPDHQLLCYLLNRCKWEHRPFESDNNNMWRVLFEYCYVLKYLVPVDLDVDLVRFYQTRVPDHSVVHRSFWEFLLWWSSLSPDQYGQETTSYIRELPLPPGARFRQEPILEEMQKLMINAGIRATQSFFCDILHQHPNEPLLALMNKYPDVLALEPVQWKMAITSAAFAGQEEQVHQLIEVASAKSIDLNEYLHPVEQSQVQNAFLLDAARRGRVDLVLFVLDDMKKKHDEVSQQSTIAVFRLFAERRMEYLKSLGHHSANKVAPVPTITELLTSYPSCFPRTNIVVTCAIYESVRIGAIDEALRVLRSSLWTTNARIGVENFGRLVYTLSRSPQFSLLDSRDQVMEQIQEVEELYEQHFNDNRQQLYAWVLNRCIDTEDFTTVMLTLDVIASLKPRWSLSRNTLRRVFNIVGHELKNQQQEQDQLPAESMASTHHRPATMWQVLQQFGDVIPLNSWTATTAIMVCAFHGLSDSILDLADEAQAQAVELDDRAVRVVQSIGRAPEKKCETASDFLRVAAENGHADQVLLLLGEMKKRREPADQRALVAVVVLLAKKRMEYLKHLEQRTGNHLVPVPTLTEVFTKFPSVLPRTKLAVATAIDWTVRTGDLDEAFRVLRSSLWTTDVAINAETFGTLVQAIARSSSPDNYAEALGRITEVEVLYDQQFEDQRQQLYTSVLNKCEAEGDFVTVLLVLSRLKAMQPQWSLSHTSLEHVLNTCSRS